MKFKKFDKDKRGHFGYWFNHVKAFNYVAWKLGVWKFKYLFHDFEKPWLMLFFLGDYSKVQKWHRTHNAHHLEYKGERDWEAMVIDWQCSMLTKTISKRNALEETNFLFDNNLIDYNTYYSLILTCRRLGIC